MKCVLIQSTWFQLIFEFVDDGSSKAVSAWPLTIKREEVDPANSRQDKKARRSQEVEPPQDKYDKDTRPKRRACLQAKAQKKKRKASEAPGPSGLGDSRVRAGKRKLGEDGDKRLSLTDTALAGFQDRYVQQHRLGGRARGSVFAGYRKRDGLQVQ